MDRFVAFTSRNDKAPGWQVVYYGESGQSRAEVDALGARAVFGGQGEQPSQTRTYTQLQNLVVLSEAQARRKAAFRCAIEQYLDER